MSMYEEILDTAKGVLLFVAVAPWLLLVNLIIFGSSFLLFCICAKRKHGVIYVARDKEYDPRKELRFLLGLEQESSFQ